MPSDPRGGGDFTEAQRAGLNTRQGDQDRTLAAMHELEATLGAAAPGRRAPWWRDVTTALAVLEEATRAEEANALQPVSLLSDIKRTQPRLRSRVRGVQAQYRQLRRALGELREEFTQAANDDVTLDVADIRQRLAWLLTALRHQRARESDLIYEAYFDAFNTELTNDPTR
jgi:hypothetical protein